jgi:excinuclease UvrABC ATPase subunit
MGPGAGKFGGKVLFEGTPPDLLKNKMSFTAEFLKKHIQ